MTLKEEREYKIIEDKLTYKADQKEMGSRVPMDQGSKSTTRQQGSCTCDPESHRKATQTESGACCSVPQANRKYDRERSCPQVDKERDRRLQWARILHLSPRGS